MLTSRALLGPGNVKLMRRLLPRLAARSPDAVIVMVSNPVDVLTHYALEITGWPPERIIGTGTLIDSARFRRMLSAALGIQSDELRAYVLGEHGPKQFAATSCASAGGESIRDTRHRRQLLRTATRIDGFLAERDVCLSLPAVIGRHGIGRGFFPDLNPEKAQSFHDSAASVREQILAAR